MYKKMTKHGTWPHTNRLRLPTKMPPSDALLYWANPGSILIGAAGPANSETPTCSLIGGEANRRFKRLGLRLGPLHNKPNLFITPSMSRGSIDKLVRQPYF